MKTITIEIDDETDAFLDEAALFSGSSREKLAAKAIVACRERIRFNKEQVVDECMDAIRPALLAAATRLAKNY